MVLSSNTKNFPSGAILIYADSLVPVGYLLCDGSAISRILYAPLFSIIGIAYGKGNGSTTFNIPNLKQKISPGKAGDTIDRFVNVNFIIKT